MKRASNKSKPKAHEAKASTAKTQSKRKTSTKATSPLAICPTGGAGWCPYPFSIEQLKKRLQHQLEEAALAGKKS